MLNTVTCPTCDAEDLRGVRFCPHCGTGLGGNGATPAVHAPLVRLLTEVADLHSRQSEQLQGWKKWTAALGAAVVLLVVVAVQLAG